MKIDLSQARTANDVCKCRGCDVKSPITIVPDMKVNKWTCRNCNLTQLWIPSKDYMEATGETAYKTSSKNAGVQKMLFCAGPLVGIGTDGCLTGVHDNPNNLYGIIAGVFFIGMLAIAVEYYRVKIKNPSAGA